ncbi:MAG TPA: ATP-binding protein [Puia sp.]|jgi:signal transduction histidine kinase/CheY-like chemotaxis protein|nr:ATP-binding protein [Puia sp.]
MSNKRFIYTILAGFITGMLLLIFIQYNSSRSIDQLIDGNRLLLRDMQVGNDLREMERDILSVESKIRAAVATGDSAFVLGVDEQNAEAEANLDTLLTMDLDGGSRADIERLAVLAKDRVRRKNIMLDSFFRAGLKPPPGLVANTTLRGASNEINDIMRRLYSMRKDRLAAVNASVTKYGRIARTSGIALSVLVLLAGSGLFWFIIDRMRKQNELIRRLDASERKLQDAVRVKEDFLANMSHEIRTPLNSIIGFTRLLDKQPLNADSREFVKAIGQSGENLMAIINDILDLSKIEAGMMRMDTRPFAVRELFHSVETLFRHRIEEKGLRFEVAVAADVPEALLGDATRLMQIVMNLISNAAKFTETGGITVRVNSREDAGAVQLWVEVRDTGIGISREQQEVIFERFSQAEGSTSRKYGGTGLGLTIVKDLIGLQNGKIELESERGRGSAFRFYIPYVIAAAPLASSASLASPVATLPRMDGICVLVADDNRMNQRLMEHLLRRAGISFDIVDDGRKALEQLREKRYHLVLMDIQMPGMDGYTTSRMIREELGSEVPIVAMTAHAMRGEREKCLASGMNEYLSKPIDAEALFGVIARFCGSGAGEAYTIIDVAYLRELSAGDRAYEIEMTEQFLEAVPEELEQLKAALAVGDRAASSKVAHNMRTTISIMGMTQRLSGLLDALEYPDDTADLSAVFSALWQACDVALGEARRFRHDKFF